jgi:competence protein ComEC
MLICILICWTLLFVRTVIVTKNCLEVTFLDVGQGDATFLKFPNGNTILIDAGNASPYWDNGLNTILPFLKHKGILHINYLLASHAHNDHIGGFCSLLHTISVDTVVLSPYLYHSDMYASLIDLCTEKRIPLKYVQRGDYLFPDKNCRVYVLHPTQEFSSAKSCSGNECNNSSIVLKVQYGENGILFPGDLERNGEQPILNFASFLECELLKVGHHGSNTSNSQELLNFVQPILAVTSVAKKNKFNHPSSETLGRLENSGIHHYLTSQKGALMFELTMTEIKKVHWRNN